MQERIPEKLILKYLSQEASEEEVDRLYSWLESDPEHADIFQEYLEVYNTKYDDKITFDTQHGLEVLSKKINDHEARRRSQVVSKWWYGAAAALIVLAVAFGNFYSNRKAADQDPVYLVKQNPLGQKSTFRLSDGTLIRLNAGSSLRFPEKFDEQERRVVLSGEAFFEVAREEDRPFVVVSEGLTTTVLGTSFNINSYSEKNETTVSVATGKVKVENNLGGSVMLLPDEQAIYHRQTNQITKRAATLERVLAWKENVLWFDNDPLNEVAEHLEKWYDITISFQGEAVQHCLLTGKFRNENLTNVLHAIEISTGINYERNDKQIIITGNGCK